MDFYLGTHRPGWLATAGVPLFVSYRTLSPRKSLPRAAARWALDSGGFTELALHGAYSFTPTTYAADVRRYQSDVGALDFAAPCDWMCEPQVVARTGLCVAEHQRRTIVSYLDLQSLAPEVSWLPVLQGWTADDYLRHVEQYAAAGVDLAAQPRVGIGTVCRRQHTAEAEAIIWRLHGMGIRLHGFGLKLRGIAQAGAALSSADSLAWSYGARRRGPCICGSTSHKNGANCLFFALDWLKHVQRVVDTTRCGAHQLSFFDAGLSA